MMNIAKRLSSKYADIADVGLICMGQLNIIAIYEHAKLIIWLIKEKQNY